MDSGGANWAIVNIVGPLILAAVLLWVFLRSRRSRETGEETEQATRRLYDGLSLGGRNASRFPRRPWTWRHCRPTAPIRHWAAPAAG